MKLEILAERETETHLVCPYCMSDKSGDEIGCCGESSAHFTEMTFYVDTGDEVES